MKIESAEFITSAADRQGWITESLPEIAIAGRSNVGKSSLINALVRRKRLAKTSSTPGKTQLVNFFRVDSTFILADLPGYGFAKVPLAVKNKWRRMVEQYLRDRDTLCGVIVLVDARRGLKDMDIDVTWSEYDKGHGLDPEEEVPDIRAFLRRCASSTPKP